LCLFRGKEAGLDVFLEFEKFLDGPVPRLAQVMWELEFVHATYVEWHATLKSQLSEEVGCCKIWRAK
jgi:hypothetical protein